MQVLPDLSDGRWNFNGTVKLSDGLHMGKAADVYVWVVTEDWGFGKVVATYSFFVDQVAAHALVGRPFPEDGSGSSRHPSGQYLSTRPFMGECISWDAALRNEL